MASGDKRRFPRIEALNIVADKGRVFRTLDLSREGMLLEMDVPAPVGTNLVVDLALGEVVLEVKGQVVRLVPQKNGRMGVGVKFDRLSPRSERHIREYLLKRDGPQPPAPG
ncbi:MAG: PilZ domain-containing protein [Planctomycetaceae bacterium]|nr:PilZ domain-containing protein [Planctomycetota bacterium]NUN52689.1 PilZ domain-containing protein [Planctomycetaceae bacterium]